MKKARAAGFAVGFVALVAGILLIPTPLRVQGTLVLTPAKPAEIYAEVPGRLVDLNVRDGEWVKANTVLATLSNPEKVRERMTLQRDYDVNMAKALWFGRAIDNASHAQAVQHRTMAQKLEPAIEKVISQIGKLNLVAPRDGQVIGVPHPETRGQWLKPGKPFCEVGDPHRLEAHLLLDQGDIDLIKVQHRAWVKIYGSSEVTYKTKVSEIAKRNRDEIPPELSNLAGGEVATKKDEKTGEAKPLTTVYEVVLPIENAGLHLECGQRGFAKIDGGIHTFGWWLWRLITKTFHFTL